MNTFLNCFKTQGWFGLLSVAVFVAFLGTFAGAVNAAPSASFAATASGTTANLTLSVTANVADADLGLSGNYYLGFNQNNEWYFHNGAGWVSYTSGVRPVYLSQALASGTVEVVRNANLTPYVGGRLYAGYGLSESDMLTNGKYAHVYTVTAESMTMGPAPVLLGSSGNFAVLAKTAVSTVPPSVIVGNVGVSPAATSFLTGFSLTAVGTTSATSPQVTGMLFGADMTTPTNSNLTTAVLDMQAAYTDAAGRPTPDYLNLGGGDIGGKNLPAGLYKWGSSVTMPADLGISGGANDVWIFQISGDLVISASKRITLADGAQAKNIFWQVEGQVIVGAGAHVEGNILSQTAITLQTGATLNGRALAQSMVALDSATVIKPAL
jgi:hypothetical protein